jgi:uncharacterized NAD(P)/FAD-binding protein YdhS
LNQVISFAFMKSAPSSRSKTVAVVGGGFSGVMTAVNLARLAAQPLEITLINHARPHGRGVAYSTRRMEHLLNVAVRNMSAFPDLPDHFLRWLQTRCEYEQEPETVLRERFIPRCIYGDYVRSLMQHYLQPAHDAAGLQVRFVEDEAIDIDAGSNGAVIHLASGGSVSAERVALATGNEPPASLPGADALTEHPAWIGNPWLPWEDRLPPDGGCIVLLGTGLTTVDALMTLCALNWHGAIHAVSRHGWLPRSHFRGIAYEDFPPAGVDLAGLGLAALVALVEEHCSRLRKMGENPAIVVDRMRPHTQRIWQSFTLEERCEFARHHAPLWNALRHRIAPEIHQQVTGMQKSGQLRVVAAAIESVEADGAQLSVHLRHADGARSTIGGDFVINGTGPQTRFIDTRNPLLRNLLRRGLIEPDDMGMGVRVTEDHTIIARDGQRSTILLALGPLLRGTLWETIAVPELRGQAWRVARTILDAHPDAETIRWDETSNALEYMI